MDRWTEIFERDLARIPQRLERFHLLLVDLFDVDATVRSDSGTWAVTRLLCNDPQVLPPSMVEQPFLDDVAVCRLTAFGANHVIAFAGLYAALYPGVRRHVRPTRANIKARSSAAGPETFTLPNRAERVVVPQRMLETMRIVATGSKTPLSLRLSPSYELTVGTNSLTLAPIDDSD